MLFPAAVLASFVAYFELKNTLPKFFQKVVDAIRKSPFESVVAAILLAVYILGACVPEREEDSLWYHLAVPLYYLTHGGRIQLVPYNLPSHYPMAVHLHYAFSLMIGNEMTAKVFMLCHWIPMLVLMWSVAKRLGLEKWGMFSVALYLTCVHFRLPTMANVQRAVYLHAFLSTILLWEYLARGRTQDFVLAAIFCGMAMATKLNALLFCFVPQMMLLLFWSVIERRMRFVDLLRMSLSYGAIAALFMLPWFLKSYILTGSPTYPLLGELFPPRAEFIGPMSINAARHGLNIPEIGNLRPFFSEIVRHARWFAYASDAIFPVGLLASIMLLFWKPGRNKRLLLVCIYISLSYTMLCLYRGTDEGRLFGINYGIVVLIISALLSRIHEATSSSVVRTFMPRVVLSAFLLTLMNGKYFYLSDPAVSWLGEIAITDNSRREWLLSHGVVDEGTFAMKEWIDANIPKEEEIYVYGRYPFYLDRKYIFSDKYFGEQLDIWLKEGPGRALEMLDRHGAKWVLLWRDKPRKRHDSPAFQFLEKSAQKVHQEKYLILYSIDEESA